MRRPNNLAASLLCGGALVAVISAIAAPLPSGWLREQSFDLTNAGLVKLSLPLETLDAARPALEDLRLYDDLSNEIPYLIERPAPKTKVVQTVKSFQVSLNADTTVITLETGLSIPIDAVTLATPAPEFIKAVRVETSDDGMLWRPLVQGEVIFRQPSGAIQSQVSFPAGVSKFLRVTVDDRRSQPVPFTGALVHAATASAAPGEWIPATITERDENPGETRLALNLGAANLVVASVRLDTGEPLFMRGISIAVPTISEDSVSEQVIGGGSIYRVALDGHPASERLLVPLENLVRSRELILLIRNGDSPPLPISAVSVERRPVNIIFLARHPGAFHLLTGNAHCAAPRYDLAAMGLNLEGVAVSPVKIPPPSGNPSYRAPEVLAGLDLTGTALDVSTWIFRKPVKISSGGAQQIELDLDVLAHAQRSLADLRVLNGSNQVPYIIQRTSISRALNPLVTATNSAKDPGLSRWIIRLPKPGLPLTRLDCVVTTPLFSRTMSLYEELTDDRGEKYRHDLGGASWTQTPERQSKEFTLAPHDGLESDTLYLETENGDNPPVTLDKLTAYYPATHILFKSAANDGIFLYYGNPRAVPPSYDLSLVADQLLAAARKTGALADEEQLRKSSWRENLEPVHNGIVFWGILSVVVLVLLVIISRLLPKPQPPTGQ